MALTLDFVGKLGVLRTKFLPGALHAIEGSLGSLLDYCSVFDLPLSQPLGLGRCLWRMLGLFYLCLMVLLGVILASVLFGVGLGSCGGIWLTDHWRCLVFMPFLV